MSISGIPSQGLYSPSYTANPSQQARKAEPAATSDDAELQELINYFNMSPEERIVKNWLEAHGLTQEEFDSLPQEKKEALRREMATDIQNQVKRKAEEKSKSMIDVLA